MRCAHPIPLKRFGPSGVKNNIVFVGCGKCVACMEKKRNEWSLRNYFELQYSNGIGTFVTLTYNDDNIPKVNGVPSLEVRDFQLFMKRLRKRLDKSYIKIRFYGCGEYGPSTHRPHYHVIIYNLKYDANTLELLEKTWQKGFVMARACDMASIRYSSKYMLTKLFDGWKPPKPEFHLSSRNPGIGIPYLREHPELKDVFCGNLTNFYTMPGGYKLPLDRYLKDRIFDDTDKLKLSQQSDEYFSRHYLDEYHEFIRLYPDIPRDSQEFHNRFRNWQRDKYNNWQSIRLKKITKSHVL